MSGMFRYLSGTLQRDKNPLNTGCHSYSCFSPTDEHDVLLMTARNACFKNKYKKSRVSKVA